MINNTKKLLVKKNEYFKYMKVQHHYKHVANVLRKKHKKGNAIKVAFLIIFKSVFPTLPIFEKILKDADFDPYIVILPNVSSIYKDQYSLYKDTYDYFFGMYGERVLHGYDENTDEYIDLSNDYDIMFFANPYSYLVSPKHHVTYFLNKNILPIYSSYGFAALKFWDEVIATPFYNFMWKCTLETQLNFEHLKKVEAIKGKNGIVTGYLKMDKLANYKAGIKIHKTIIICPHHTVWGDKGLNIGNFLKYSEFFLKLAELFPNINFIFRPHPLLFTNIKSHKIWTDKQIENYTNKLASLPNMMYDTSGDYMQVFADSDAMIHDCGSFIGEYLYTKKPCCYMMKSEEETMNGLVPLGQECMKQYYHAFDEKDIVDFIQNVVINGNDPLKEQRENFAENELMVNYPNAAEKFIEYIKKELKIKY